MVKKILNIFVVALLLVAGIFALVNLGNRNNVKATTLQAEDLTTVSSLLSSYIQDGKYTKLTTLNYPENAENYHGGASARQRRTYYDENVNALLMGNYDGSFGGEGGINSGYAKNGSDMEHYRNNAESISLENLFNARNVDYSVHETNPVAFFDVLSELAAKVNETSPERWSYNGDGIYTYDDPEPLTISGTIYSNEFLKMCQYFAAPMLLVNNAVNLDHLNISEVDGYLGGTLTKALEIELVDKYGVWISRAYILKGLTMEKFVKTDASKLYLDASQFFDQANWASNNARFAAYFFDGSADPVWIDMDSIGNDEYSVTIPSGYNQVIFGRMDPENPENGFGSSKWNQTVDLTFSLQQGMTFRVKYWNVGDNKSGGDWEIKER